MKSLGRLAGILLALTFLMPFSSGLKAQSQGTVNLKFTVKDNQGRPMVDTPVEFIEINSRKQIIKKTNAEGTVTQTFNEGRYWQINVKDIRNFYFWQFEVTPGKRMNLNKRVTYDFDRYARETRPAVDRKQLLLKTIPQKLNVDARPDKENGIVKLQIKKSKTEVLPNFPVSLTCYKLHKTFTAKTNPAGYATFQVPINQEYEIDIDGINSYEYVDLPNKPMWRQTKTFIYSPTIVKEKVVRDTVEQFLTPDQKGTSGSVIAAITFKGGPDKVWRNEPVFLEVLGEKKWYRGKTDQNGQVRFLLPKGKRYMIHGRYEFDLDVVDLRRRRGIGYSNKSVVYRPKEKYQYPEKYIPNPTQLVVDAFQNFLEKQYANLKPADAVSSNIQFGGPINALSKEAVLRLAFVSDAEGAKDLAPPLNISLVIDKSGSMSGHDRIDQLKLSLIEFVKRLRPNDIISLVIFEDFETVLVPAKAVGNSKARLIQLIERIEADGGTDIFEGLKAGYSELQKNYKSNYTNRLILLTDGYDGTPIEDFAKLQEPYTAKGMECSAVGVGEDYNLALLQLLATKGGGFIEHVGDARGIQEVFLKQIGSMLYPVAKNVTVDVTYNKHLQYKQLYGFPVKERSGNHLKIKLKNAYNGLNQLAFLRFNLIDPTPEIVNQPVVVKVRYTDIRTKKVVETVTEVKLEWSEASGELELLAAQNEKKMYTIAVMNQSLKAMSDKFHSGDLAGARTALEDGLATLKKVNPNSDEDLASLREELEKYLDILVNQR